MSNTVIRTNTMAMTSHNALTSVGNEQAKASQRLSTGYQINSAADNASGLAISEKMRSQIRGLEQASTNAQDGISLLQTAEGGLQEIDNMVQRSRELVVQSASDINTVEDKGKIDAEINQLGSEIVAMSQRVEFNGRKLIDGSVSTISFQVGANAGQITTINIGDYDMTSIGQAIAAVSTAGMSSVSAISALLPKFDSALSEVTDFRATLGVTQNRLEYTIKSLDTTVINLSASESRIRDTDMAEEMMNLTQANVLQQAATSMLAQANQQPNNILQLLR